MKILLASPRGFCAGVANAVDVLERALKHYGAPIYINHDIVHNRILIEQFQQAGAVFCQSIADIPDDSIAVISAHGIGNSDEQELRRRCRAVINATCPLVSKVHRHAQEYESTDRTLLLIGHKNHQEIQGTLGQLKRQAILVENCADVKKLGLTRDTKIAYVSQTTLSVDEVLVIISAIKEEFDDVIGPDIRNICYATQNRQFATKRLLALCDVLLVIGSKHSSNTMRLYEIGLNSEIATYIIDSAFMLEKQWLYQKTSIGIISGASVPEFLVKELVEYLKKNFTIASVSDISFVDERIQFPAIKLP